MFKNRGNGLRPQGMRLSQRLSLGGGPSPLGPIGGGMGAAGAARPYALGPRRPVVRTGTGVDTTLLTTPTGTTASYGTPSPPETGGPGPVPDGGRAHQNAARNDGRNAHGGRGSGREEPENPIEDPLYSGKGSGFKGIRRRMMQQAYANAQWAQPFERASLIDLINEANTDHFSQEGRAAFLAPRLEALSQAIDTARGRMVADQSARGIDESSYGAAASGALDHAAAVGRARLVGDLYDAEQNRQAQTKAQLGAALAAYRSGNVQAAQQIMRDIAEWKIQQQQLEAQQGNWWDSLGQLAGYGAMIGKYT